MTEKPLGRYSLHLIIGALVLCTFIAYLPVLHNGFAFDDALYLTKNPNIQTPSAVGWAFTSFYGANWHPVTWLSTLLDVRLYGMNPAGHHVTNLLFHIANTVLLLLVLRRLTGSLWKSAFVAALFAVHPLHVESVAWVAERKDVLSTFLLLLTVGAYIKYTERPSMSRNAGVVVLFAFGLMAKPMLVSLPILLLLLDFWPLRRTTSIGGKGKSGGLHVTRLILEKAPLFALSAASCVVTYLAQKSALAVIQLQEIPAGLRLANSLVAYTSYIVKMLWPSELAAYYPYPSAGIAAPMVVSAALLLVGVTAFALRSAGSRPYLLVGWLWYLVTLLPVIGLLQVGEQSMADRYTYIPLIGLFIMIAWWIPGAVGEKASGARILPLTALAVMVLVALMACTYRQSGYWKDDYTLFKHTVEVTQRNAFALTNYGVALAEKGKYPEAIEQYKASIAADPEYAQSYVDYGNALKSLGETQEAMKLYSKALEVKPDFPDATQAIANVMADQGNTDAAAAEYSRALESDPNDANAHYNLGRVLALQGKVDDAVSHFRRAIELDPRYHKAYYNLAVIETQQGKFDQSIADYNNALRINPNYAEAHRGLAVSLAAQGKMANAEQQFRQALKADPNYAEAHNNLGMLLMQQGRGDEAVSHFESAVKSKPGLAEAHANLGMALASKGNVVAAIPEYEQAVRAKPDYVLAHGNLAYALYSTGRYSDAWKEVRICEQYGTKLPPDFMKALSSKMPAP